jgi:lipopolysaccharide biosynthesis glycosyltransferase
MNKDTLEYNKALFKGSEALFRQNSNTPYKGNPEDKLKILEELNKKFEYAQSLDSQVNEEGKNLLYYTVFGVDYTMLLELSLKSLINTEQNKNFDILLITDTYTLKILHTLDCLKEFNWDYHLVSQPIDGVEASIYKLKIHEYTKLKNYNKILFLDTDVICRGKFTDIFYSSTLGKFEVVKSPLERRHFFDKPNLIRSATLSHSLSFFTEKNKEFILKNKPVVFNAGHFYFQNTEQMKQHFKNVLWLIEVWPSVYFYEQSFLNQYFNLNNLSSYLILNKYINVTMHLFKDKTVIPEQFEKQHEDSHTLIHFAGSPTKGKIKYLFIKHYCKYFDICL